MGAADDSQSKWIFSGLGSAFARVRAREGREEEPGKGMAARVSGIRHAQNGAKPKTPCRIIQNFLKKI